MTLSGLPGTQDVPARCFITLKKDNISVLSSLIFQVQDCHKEQGFSTGLIP